MPKIYIILPYHFCLYWREGELVINLKLGEAVIKNIKINRTILNKGLSILLVIFACLQSIHYVSAAGSTTGQQNTLVILLNFKENPNEQPLTLSEANNLIFGTVNDFYRESSFEQMWLSGKVVGWFNLPLSNQVCDFTAVQDAADQEAIAAGVKLEEYDRIVYLMTKTACGVAGSATIDGMPSRAHINGDFSPMNIAHELGHNFGLHHSRALDCGEHTLSDNCTLREYGDTYDVMGGPDIGYLNTFQRERLGWLEGEHASKTLEVTQNGTYSIANYETTSEQPVTIKVPRGTDPSTGAKKWFYIEYRQSIGFDDFLDARSYSFYRGDVTDGIIIRSAVEGDGRSSNLLHFKTDSEYRAVFGRNDWFDPSMPVGGSYTDPDSGVTLSLVSAANGIAEVSVVFDGSDNGNIGTCTVNAPSVTAKAATNNSVAAGDEVQYQVTITNKDSADCSASSFSVNTSVPTGWKVSRNAITLAAGETGQVMISVVSSVDASDKDYALNMIVTHGEDSSLQTAASVNYSVTTEISPSPELVAVDDQVTMSSKQSVIIDVMANDVVGEQNSASVLSFTRPSKGRLELLSDGTLRYTPEKKFKNNDSFTYTIGDGQSSSTAQVSVKLESSSGGDSGNSGNNGKGKNK